jgi:hypothetical protein
VLLGLQRAVALAGLAAMLLKPAARAPGRSGVRGFNKVFERTTNGYVGVSRLLVRSPSSRSCSWAP